MPPALQLCESHIDALQREIKSRGLWDLCPQNPAEFAKYVRAWRSHPEAQLATFSPIHFAAGVLASLRNMFLEEFPYDAMSDPDTCCLCAADPDLAELWLTVAGDNARNAAAMLMPTNAALILS